MKKKNSVKPSSEGFVYKEIKYSDENILSKIHNFEEVSKRKVLKESAKRASFLSLYV